MKKRLQDIARETGYSVTTVSRALNGSNEVAPEAKNAILNCARRIGYLQGKRTVVLILPQFDAGFYYRDMIPELYTLLQFMGYKIEIICADSLELIEEHNLCGAISIMAQNGLERYWGERHILPLVCINTRPRHFEGIYTVASNERHGMRLLTEYLIRQGHQRIGLCVNHNQNHDPGQPENFSGALRQETFRQVMREHGLPDDLLAFYRWSDIELSFTIQKLVEMKVTAIITMTEGIAPRVLHILKSQGKRVPEDISLAGWLDSVEERYCDPPITGIMQNFNYLAKQAVTMLQKQLHKEPVTEDVFLDYNFFPRNSTGPIPPGE